MKINATLTPQRLTKKTARVFELAGQKIRANTVSPGNTYFKGGVWEQIEHGNPDLFKMALGLNPTGRMGTPQEMANAAVFLASPAASFITASRPIRSASRPAVIAPAAAPSNAEATAKPSDASPMPKCFWIDDTAPLMTALS